MTQNWTTSYSPILFHSSSFFVHASQLGTQGVMCEDTAQQIRYAFCPLCEFGELFKASEPPSLCQINNNSGL